MGFLLRLFGRHRGESHAPAPRLPLPSVAPTAPSPEPPQPRQETAVSSALPSIRIEIEHVKPRRPRTSVKAGPLARAYPNQPIGFRLVHELEGLLTGIRADGQIVPIETDRLVRWLAEAAPYRHVRPFSEISDHIEDALADGVLTMEEAEDLLFVAQRYTTVNPHFGAMRTGLQVLMGIMAGVAADRAVPESELKALSSWLEEWHHLAGLWPYDECESLVVALLARPLDLDVIQQLLALTVQFPIAGHITEHGEVPPLMVGGICAVDPAITFQGRQFVFTGDSERADRADMEQHVLQRQGIPHPRVTKETDFLVVCDGGSPYWAFSCYGRKVEHACNLRRSGHHIAIVREADFWDALVS